MEHNEMSHREELHVQTQRDIKSIKMQVDNLSGVVGTMNGTVGTLVTALKGNDMGTEGILPQVLAIKIEQGKIKLEQETINRRLDEVSLLKSKNQMYLIAFVAVLAAGLGAFLTAFFNYLFKK